MGVIALPGLCLPFVKLHVSMLLVLYYDVHYDFHAKTNPVRLYFHLFSRGSNLYSCYLHLFTHTGIKHDFLYQLLLVSFNSNTMCVASCGLAAYASGAPEFTPLFLGGSCCLVYLVFSVVLCRSVFALLSFLYWTWHCQSFFNLRAAYHFGIFKLFSLIK